MTVPKLPLPTTGAQRHFHLEHTSTRECTFVFQLFLNVNYFSSFTLNHSYCSNKASNVCVCFTHVIPAGFSKQHKTMKTSPVSMLFSRGYSFIEQPEILAIFGVMPFVFKSLRGRKAQSAEQD